MKNCENCGGEFEVTERDREYYVKLKVPEAVCCHPCRSQRRLAWRNERNLYGRKCDLTGKDIISIYPAEAPFPVYEPEAWFGDGWDGMDYGMDCDFDRPFFEQFRELLNKTPKMALHVMNLENSPYVNQCWYTKNSYLCFDMGFSENNLYCHVTYHSKSVMDCSFTRNCELSYGLVDCQKCYNSVHLQDCNGCYDAFFSYDCRGCNNVAFCWNLRNKEYHIFNKPVSKEEFEAFVREFKEGSYEKFLEYERDFHEQVLAKAVRRANHNINVENCVGDYLVNDKNCSNCYDCADSEDLNLCTRMDEQGKDCMDIDHGSIIELGYESMSVAGHNMRFGLMSLHCNDTTYFHTLKACKDCFGCSAIKNKQYCILNKQYSREEYEAMVPRIIEHMKTTGEWGQFFPAEDSIHAYNETCAQDRFPLSREEVLTKGYKWRDKDSTEYQRQSYEMPDKIVDVNEGICSEILACEVTGKNFRIIPQELAFYKKIGLPVPRRCPEQRISDRLKLRTPYKTWRRGCTKCGVEIETSYAPERPEIVYCEQCYLGVVY